jgi:hypothetical protein
VRRRYFYGELLEGLARYNLYFARDDDDLAGFLADNFYGSLGRVR